MKPKHENAAASFFVFIKFDPEMLKEIKRKIFTEKFGGLKISITFASAINKRWERRSKERIANEVDCQKKEFFERFKI